MAIGMLRARVRDLARDHGVKLFFIDYFQLLLPDDGDSFPSICREREEELRLIKEMALEFRVAVIALSQVRRPTRKGFAAPVYAELETYCPFADEYADKIILLHRPGLYGLHSDGHRDGIETIQLSVVKNSGGPTADLYFHFDRDRIRVTAPNEERLDVTDHEEDRHGAELSFSFDDLDAVPF